MSERYLIAGLGNPGKEYSNTRHNIGFRCVDTFARIHDMTFDKKQGKARIASGHVAGFHVLLAKPQTFMNLSGESISFLAHYYKISPNNIMIIFDDMDLPVGTLRIRKQGGSSGQKGMRHIIQLLGTQEINRIRFGIGRPPGRMDPAAYVLRPFDNGDEAILVDETIDRALKAVTTWLTDGIDKAMNLYNGSIEDIARRQAEEAAEARDTPNQTASDTHKEKPETTDFSSNQ
jgi:PTH1 family peptidyl-tRNA hydrolase